MTDKNSTNDLRALIRLNAVDFVEAFDIPHVEILDLLLRIPMQFPARSISKTVLDYDHLINTRGLQAASQWLVGLFAQRVSIYNSEAVPATGPVLLVSNHPGMVDAIAIFASIVRKDLLIIAKERPALHHLGNLSNHLIYVPESDHGRISTVRQTTGYLRAGKSLLLFPAGEIEPDPALHPNLAVQKLKTWSQSISLFARCVPGLTILPVAVSGVISRSALRNPLIHLYHTQARRDWVAATLMILYKSYRDVTVDVRYGTPIKIAGDDDIRSLAIDVSEQMASLYRQQ